MFQLKSLNPNKSTILITSFLFRLGFFLFGLYQDANMPLPYTDIDYYVFTDAAKLVSQNASPYLRATYRYTPLLAWFLVPTTYTTHPLWFSFGKFLFIICDLLTGYLAMVSIPSNLQYLSLIWFYNPVVTTISTRGSSESLLTSIILFSIHVLANNTSLLNIIISGILLGASIHLKIYPIIYSTTLLLFIDSNQSLWRPITFRRIIFVLSTILGFTGLSFWMYQIYEQEYIDEAFLYHLIRLDHRHNFSLYNISLYLSSYLEKGESLNFEKWSFIPQLGLSLILIPLFLSEGFKLNNKQSKIGILYRILFVQTFTFITFNKVCTSQYFIWFLCFLPQYLAWTTISRRKGIILMIGWIFTQALWLFNGWRLEFRGDSDVFTLGLFSSSCMFFIWNSYLICEFVDDIKRQTRIEFSNSKKKNK